MKFTIVGSLHGTEPFGAEVVKKIQRNKLGVKTIVGNPQALAKKRRYVNSDLNRAFSGDGKGIERKRATEILAQVKNSDYLIDIHNTTTNVGNAVIVNNLNPKTCQIINNHPGDKIVLLPKKHVKRSLIGQFTDGAVAFEYSHSYCSRKRAYDEVIDTINGVLEGHVKPKRPRTIFVVSRKIRLDEAKSLTEADNFNFIPALNGYGFLIGEIAYKNRHGGFLATKKEIMLI